MKKLLSIALFLALLALPLAAPAETKEEADAYAAQQAQALTGEQKQVNVFTWTYYIPDEVIADFEAATGIRVNYAPFLDNEDIIAKLSVESGQYDVVVCSDYIINDLAGLGLLAPIDFAALPNAKNIDPQYQSQYYDPENLYTIPYTTTIPLIVYDPAAVDFAVKGVADLWNPAFEHNLVLLGEWRNVIGLAQKKLGLSFNETDPEKMARVAQELEALKPNIALFNDDTPHNALIYGDAIAGFMYGSQIVAARAVKPELQVVYPEEGVNFGIDCLITPVGAPHPEATAIFLNYLLDGEVSAYASDLIDYGNCNLAAPAYMTEEFLSERSINVPAEVLAKGEMFKSLAGDELALYDSIWTAFRQG